MIFNKGQESIIQTGVTHIKKSSKQVFEFDGPAGTGKSVVLNEIVRRSGIPTNRIAAMAFIGQAAIVMRFKGFPSAKTIHSTLYEPVDIPLIDSTGQVVIDKTLGVPVMTTKFVPKDLTQDVDLFIIDEAGSVPLSMKREIESRGKKIIAAGDLGQLPPVGDSPAYLHGHDIMHLDEVMRQGGDSGLLYIANRVRKGLPVQTGFYGDCLVIYQDEISDELILRSDMIICGKNATRDMYNNYIRNDLLGIKSDLPKYKEKMICRKNDWSSEVDGIALANGLCGELAEPVDVATLKNDVFEMSFRPNLFNSVFYNVDTDYIYLNSSKTEREERKNNPYARGHKFEYAYALTTHLAQGGQCHSAIVIQEYLSQELNDRLWYTGVTRPTSYLIYAIHRKKYY